VTAPAYLDATQPTPARVADLVSRMTLAEKVGQMMQMHTYDGVDHLIEKWHVGSILHASPDSLARAHELQDRSRLGIPLLIGEDCIHGHSFFKGATIFPTQLGLAATFDPELIRRVGRATARSSGASALRPKIEEWARSTRSSPYGQSTAACLSKTASPTSPRVSSITTARMFTPWTR